MLEDAIQDVERELRRLLSSQERPRVLMEAMRWAVEGGGKRIRPRICLASAVAVGGASSDAILPACAVELLHSYTLVHDDLPAMDNDDYRRGRLTNHKVYGDGQAVLAGDGLLSLAFEILLDACVEGAVPVKAIQAVAQGAGVCGMVAGQTVDLTNPRGETPMESEAMLRYIHQRKTGALLTASLVAGAICGGADEAKLNVLRLFGQCYGMLFQITDDILDVIGDSEEVGKTLGKDENEHKLTYTTLFGVEEAKRLAQEAADEAIFALVNEGERADFFRALVMYTLERKS
jgi:geranylgeranyl diphosphate synthase type II